MKKTNSVALGVIFILNSVALFYFRQWVIGWIYLKESSDYGAIAIHDTSSVVGAASKFGTEALQIATTVKLACLWIIPVALITAFILRINLGS
jgi:uncharacterized membrane protein YadS